MNNKVIRGLVMTGMVCVMLSACGSKEKTDNVESTEVVTTQEVTDEVKTEVEQVTEITEADAPRAEAVTLTADDFVVTPLDDGTVMLTQYSGDAESVIIPSEVSGMTVTVIGEDAFINHDELVFVKIPDTVIEIRKQAFMNCFNLKEVTMSKNIKTIGTFAFSSLEEIELPDTLKELGVGAFSGCEIIKLTIPSGLEKTGVFAFAQTDIEELIVPSNIKVIEEEAFRLSEQLRTVVIEEGVEVIEKGAFKQCDLLESVTIPASVTEITNPFNSSENVTIYTPSGSYAETWAAENGIPCVAQ